MITLAKKKSADLLIVSEQLVGLGVHFFGRSFPCLGTESCPGCIYQPARPHWYGYSLSHDTVDVVEFNLSGYEAVLRACEKVDSPSPLHVQLVMQRKTTRGKWECERARRVVECTVRRPLDSLLLAVATVFYLPLPPSATNLEQLVKANRPQIEARLRRAIGILPHTV